MVEWITNKTFLYLSILTQKQAHKPMEQKRKPRNKPMIILLLFFKDFIYLFMRDRERGREREAETGRGRSRLHAGSLMWDSMWDLIPGLQDQALG